MSLGGGLDSTFFCLATAGKAPGGGYCDMYMCACLRERERERERERREREKREREKRERERERESIGSMKWICQTLSLKRCP